MTGVKRSAPVTPAPSLLDLGPGRSAGLDAFRGVAVLLMVADHLALVLGDLDAVRLTLGRLALPMFFLLAGHLAGRPRLRHAGVGLLGVLLPVVVPWIDAPNVLTLWALGVAVLWALRSVSVPGWVPAAVALTLLANGWTFGGAGFYDPAALLGLMALGSLLPRSAFEWAGSLPAGFVSVGRRPVTWYVGHLLALHGLVLLFR